jgi:hypothetical protein
MSTRANLIFPPELEVVETPSSGPRTQVQSIRSPWDAGQFADQQIRRLVRQVFFPGWPKPARHVVFSAINEDTDVAGICLKVGEVLAEHIEGRVGVIETSLVNSEFEDAFGVKGISVSERDEAGSLRSVSHQISNRLWLVPPTSFWCAKEPGMASAGIEYSVGQIKHEFDYTVLHASPAGSSSEAAVLGQLCDGIVLVLEAHSTRRVTAQKVLETLQAANVRLFGTVLNGRTFPVPEGLYKRL